MGGGWAARQTAVKRGTGRLKRQRDPAARPPFTGAHPAENPAGQGRALSPASAGRSKLAGFLSGRNTASHRRARAKHRASLSGIRPGHRALPLGLLRESSPLPDGCPFFFVKPPPRSSFKNSVPAPEENKKGAQTGAPLMNPIHPEPYAGIIQIR